MRRVFFSFHYDDVFRAMLVRNMWAIGKDRDFTGFVDAAEKEKLKLAGKLATQRWIDRQLAGTSVTVVLIGSKTLSRDFVKYEIEQSIRKRNGLLGIHINKLKPLVGPIKAEPVLSSNLDRYNPSMGVLESIITPQKYETKSYASSPVTNATDYHNWVRHNIGDWVEEAARRANR